MEKLGISRSRDMLEFNRILSQAFIKYYLEKSFILYRTVTDMIENFRTFYFACSFQK